MDRNINTFKFQSVYLLPNLITISALLCAFLAITSAINYNYQYASILIFASMLLDSLDGRIARLTKGQSSFGEQLDSLADMVSFGVAPAIIIYMYQLKDFGKIGYSIAFIYCACTALRLALFNTLIGKVDKKWFIGIPSPSAAALIMGLIWVVNYNYSKEEIIFIEVIIEFIKNNIHYISLILTLFAGISMVVQIKFWSFKDINIKSKTPFLAMVIAVLVLLFVTWNPPFVMFIFFLFYSLSGYLLFSYNKISNLLA